MVKCGSSASQAGFHIEEDQYSDSERGHATEHAGYIVFEEAFALSGSSSTYETSGTLESSAFGPVSNFNLVKWTEDIPLACSGCAVKVQIKTAPDSGGSPGTWSSDWSDYFTEADGTLLPIEYFGDQWLKYLITLEGDGSQTPTLSEVKIDYYE